MKICDETQKEPLCNSNSAVFRDTTFCLHCGVWGLTACRVRHIRAALSWCPVSAGNGDGAKLPENPANRDLSGQNGFIISGWAVVTKRKQLLLPKISEE